MKWEDHVSEERAGCEGRRTWIQRKVLHCHYHALQVSRGACVESEIENEGERGRREVVFVRSAHSGWNRVWSAQLQCSTRRTTPRNFHRIRATTAPSSPQIPPLPLSSLNNPLPPYRLDQPSHSPPTLVLGLNEPGHTSTGRFEAFGQT
jgi:hypothetical protein